MSHHQELQSFIEVLKFELHQQEARFTKIIKDHFHQMSGQVVREFTVWQAPIVVSEDAWQNSLQHITPQNIEDQITPSPQNGNGVDVNRDMERQESPLSPGRRLKMSRNSNISSFNSSHLAAKQMCPCLDTFIDKFGEDQIIDDTNCFNAFVLSKAFMYSSTLVVCLHAVYLGYTSEYALANLSHPRTRVFDILDVSFGVFYLVELALKLVVYKCGFFYNSDWMWNSFETFLVVFSIFEEVSKFYADNAAGGNDVGIIRLLKLLKTMKMLRFLRRMNIFRELRQFLMPLVKSLRSLFWTMLMLGLFMYIFAVIFMQGVVNHTLDEGLEATPDLLLTDFGSVSSCMVSLFKSVTGGDDWSMYAEPLKDIGLFYYMFFFFYISFLQFAVLNILTGIFIDNAMRLSNSDDANKADELRLNEGLKTKLLKALAKFDEDKTGALDMDEFTSHLHTHAMRKFLMHLDVSTEQANSIMKRLYRESPEGVNLEMFLDCLFAVKGPARSLEVHELIFDVSLLRHQILDIAKSQKTMASYLARSLHAVEAELSDVSMQRRWNSGAQPSGTAVDSQHSAGNANSILSV